MQIKGLQAGERAKAQDIPPPCSTTSAQTAEKFNPQELGNRDKGVQSNTHKFGYHHSRIHTPVSIIPQLITVVWA